MAPFATQPPQEPALKQLGVEPVGLCSAMLARPTAIAPAMQQAKQPFWARLQLLARLTLNAGKHAANQPARPAQLGDGDGRAIVVQGDEDLLKSFGWGITALHRF
ncbi:MAG: hypothetical protein JO122_13620 [Acetobacteraceae bacterium]|nr:hypothetical protein [Acetobacteraceae bacterium]